MYRNLLFIIILITKNAVGQEAKVSGIVTDADGHPLPHVRYYTHSNPTQKLYTNNEGEYQITYQLGNNDTIHFQNVAFDDYDLYLYGRYERMAKREGQISIDIIMPDKQIPEIVILPDLPDTLFGTQDYSVADFEFDTSGCMVLLTYPKTIQKGSVLRLLDQNDSITDRHYIEGESVELRKDFQGNIHLLTKERVFLVKVIRSKMYVYEENRDQFFKYLAPILDTIGPHIYYSNYSELYPAFDYLEFNREDSTYNTLLKVEDAPLMELYRAEFKYVDVRTKLWAANKELQTGIDKEIWVGANVFTNSLYYEPLYAPLFKAGEDSIYVFDHYKNYLFKYTPDTGFSDSVRISYHLDARKSGWEQPLLQDRVNDQVYVLFERNGYSYLCRIDPKSGNVSSPQRLHYKYVERIKIVDNNVYYIYRPFETIQKKYIYKEGLQ